MTGIERQKKFPHRDHDWAQIHDSETTARGVSVYT